MFIYIFFIRDYTRDNNTAFMHVQHAFKTNMQRRNKTQLQQALTCTVFAKKRRYTCQNTDSRLIQPNLCFHAIIGNKTSCSGWPNLLEFFLWRNAADRHNNTGMASLHRECVLADQIRNSNEQNCTWSLSESDHSLCSREISHFRLMSHWIRKYGNENWPQENKNMSYDGEYANMNR